MGRIVGDSDEWQVWTVPDVEQYHVTRAYLFEVKSEGVKGNVN